MFKERRACLLWERRRSDHLGRVLRAILEVSTSSLWPSAGSHRAFEIISEVCFQLMVLSTGGKSDTGPEPGRHCPTDREHLRRKGPPPSQRSFLLQKFPGGGSGEVWMDPREALLSYLELRRELGAAFPAGSVCSGCRNKIPRTGWLKAQKCISSQFCRLGVQDRGAGRVGFL